MATAYSQPRQYSGYLEEYNKEFLAAAMGAKQGAYNIGRAQAQEAYNQYSNLDLLKDEDKAYFKDNLYQLNEQVKMAGMGDLSQAGVVDNLTSYYSKAMDENVLNAYAGTKTIRKIQAEAEASKKDGKYSDLNYSYSMEAANKWASDGKVGSKYEGNSTYVPYTDKQAKIIEIFKEHKPDIKVTMDSSGVQHFVYKSEVLSAEKVQDILDGLVYANPEIAQQMKVDAWGQFQGLSDESVSETLKGSVVTKRENVQKQINSGKYKGEDLQYLNDLKDSLTTDINEWDTQYKKNPTAYKEFFYKQNFSQSIKDIYVKNNLIDISSITDQAALENLKHSHSMIKVRAEGEQARMTEAQKMVADEFQKNGSADNSATYLTMLGIPTGNMVIDTKTGKPRQQTWIEFNEDFKELTAVQKEPLVLTPNVKGQTNFDVLSEQETRTKTEEIGLIGEAANILGVGTFNPASSLSDTKQALLSKLATNKKETDASKTLTAVEENNIRKVVAKMEDLEFQQSKTNSYKERSTKAVIEAAKASPGKIIDLGDGETVFYDAASKELRYQNRRTAGEAVPAGGMLADMFGVTSAKEYWNKLKAIDSQVTILQPFWARKNPENVATIENFLAGNVKVNPALLSSRNQVKLAEIEELRKQRPNGKAADLTTGQAEDILSYLSDFKKDEALNLTARNAQNNPSLKRENEGLAFTISEDELYKRINTKVNNNTLSKPSMEIVNRNLEGVNIKASIGYSQAIALNPVNGTQMANGVNSFLGTNIDFSEKDSYKNLGVEVVGDNTTFTVQVKDDKTWTEPITKTVPTTQAYQLQGLQRLIDAGNTATTIERSNEVMDKNITDFKVIGNNTQAKLPVFDFTISERIENGSKVEINPIDNITITIDKYNGTYNYGVEGATKYKDDFYIFLNKNFTNLSRNLIYKEEPSTPQETLLILEKAAKIFAAEQDKTEKVNLQHNLIGTPYNKFY